MLAEPNQGFSFPLPLRKKRSARKTAIVVESGVVDAVDLCEGFMAKNIPIFSDGTGQADGLTVGRCCE